MKKLFLLSLFALLTLVTQNTQADFGSSFGGAMTGSLVGGVVSGAMQPRQQTVVVRDNGDDYDERPSKRSRKRTRELEEALDDKDQEIKKLKQSQADLEDEFNRRLKALENKTAGK